MIGSEKQIQHAQIIIHGINHQQQENNIFVKIKCNYLALVTILIINVSHIYRNNPHLYQENTGYS